MFFNQKEPNLKNKNKTKLLYKSIIDNQNLKDLQLFGQKIFIDSTGNYRKNPKIYIF